LDLIDARKVGQTKILMWFISVVLLNS